MLIQWLLTMALTAEITLGSMQGFLLLAKLQQAQIALAQEQEQIRFLVGYFRSMLHRDNILILVNSRQQSILEVHQEMTHQFFLVNADNKRGQTLFVKEGDHRREALSSGLQSLSLKFCIKKNAAIDCRPAADIQEWSDVGAIEFNLQFLSNSALDNIVRLNNDHRWQFILKLGESA